MLYKFRYCSMTRGKFQCNLGDVFAQSNIILAAISNDNVQVCFEFMIGPGSIWRTPLPSHEQCGSSLGISFTTLGQLTFKNHDSVERRFSCHALRAFVWAACSAETRLETHPRGFPLPFWPWGSLHDRGQFFFLTLLPNPSIRCLYLCMCFFIQS